MSQVRSQALPKFTVSLGRQILCYSGCKVMSGLRRCPSFPSNEHDLQLSLFSCDSELTQRNGTCMNAPSNPSISREHLTAEGPDFNCC